MIKWILGLLGLGGLLALAHSFFLSGDKAESEVLENKPTAQSEALEVKDKVKNEAMAKMGRQGGLASAKARKEKREKQGQAENEQT